MDLHPSAPAGKNIETETLSNRRIHDRKDLRVPVLCHFEPGVLFPGLSDLRRLKWVCVNLGQGGILLETQGFENPPAEARLERVQSQLFGKPQPRVYYPALPPEKLRMSVELRFPKKKNFFTLNGYLAWFRHLAKDVYRLAICFDEGQDLHIYRDRAGELMIAVIWKESDL